MDISDEKVNVNKGIDSTILNNGNTVFNDDEPNFDDFPDDDNDEWGGDHDENDDGWGDDADDNADDGWGQLLDAVDIPVNNEQPAQLTKQLSQVLPLTINEVDIAMTLKVKVISEQLNIEGIYIYTQIHCICIHLHI